MSIVAEGWPEAVLVALAVASAFGLGGWFADRRVAAVLAVVRSFCEEATVYYRAREDGRIDDAETRRIADAAGGSSRALRRPAQSCDGEAPCPTSRSRPGTRAGRQGRR